MSNSISTIPPLKNALLLRAARRMPVERVPVWMMRQAGRTDPAYLALRKKVNLPLEQLFRDVERAIEISLLPQRIGVDAIIMYQDILTPLTPMGAHFRFAPGPVLETPIRTWGQVEALRPVDPSSQLKFVGQILRGLRRELDGALPVIGFAGAPLTLALFMIAGTSPMTKGVGISDEAKVAFRLMNEEPRLFHELLQRLTRLTIDYLNYQISEGAQAVQLFESVADQIERPRYETFVQPYHEQIFAELNPSVPSILFAKECTYLDLMLKSASTVLSVGRCVDLSTAQAEAKGKVAFQGNVDNGLLRDGTLDDITAAVNRCLQQGGKIGHILNLNHGLDRDTSFEHVKHFVEAAKAYVWPEAANQE
ncbi:uroporphyrinogen decarboxylase [Candidatus Poribacteria bacterium]|nr:uroporphyrinogen decarboxylase [Candidatus Poribacteria bacterium]